MSEFRTIADRNAIHTEMPWEARDLPRTLYQMLAEVRLDSESIANSIRDKLKACKIQSQAV